LSLFIVFDLEQVVNPREDTLLGVVDHLAGHLKLFSRRRDGSQGFIFAVILNQRLLLFAGRSISIQRESTVSDELMRLVVFGERVQAEDGENVHVKVVNHEADIAKTTRSLDGLLLELSPENQVDEDLGDFFERFQVDVLRSQT